MKYKKAENGQWVQPVRAGYKIKCCDCGLVHRIDFRLLKNGRGTTIQMRYFRDERATAAARRKVQKIKKSS